jgi:Tfp pilus assembly protein PilO
MKNGSRIWAKRAGLLAAAGLLLAGNLGFFVWYRGTARDRREALEMRRAALEREVHTKEQEARKLSDDRKRLTEVRSALDKFYSHSVGLRRETLAGFVDELHTTLKRVGVSPSEISYSTSVVQDPPISQMLVSFGFKGDYGKLKELLDALQTNRKWIAVRDISLNRDADVPGAVQVRLSMVTYFSGEESEVSRAALTGGTAR